MCRTILVFYTYFPPTPSPFPSKSWGMSFQFTIPILKSAHYYFFSWQKYKICNLKGLGRTPAEIEKEEPDWWPKAKKRKDLFLFLFFARTLAGCINRGSLPRFPQHASMWFPTAWHPFLSTPCGIKSRLAHYYAGFGPLLLPSYAACSFALSSVCRHPHPQPAGMQKCSVRKPAALWNVAQTCNIIIKGNVKTVKSPLASPEGNRMGVGEEEEEGGEAQLCPQVTSPWGLDPPGMDCNSMTGNCGYTRTWDRIFLGWGRGRPANLENRVYVQRAAGLTPAGS